MSKKISIAIDAMGGDNSPSKTIEGIKLFLDKNKKNDDFILNIFGKKDVIQNKLKELEELKANSKYWNISYDLAQELSNLVKGSKNILEIGTSNGYSALWMYYGSSGVNITTIEVNFERYEEAKWNFKEAGANIRQINGEALDTLMNHKFDEKFDIVVANILSSILIKLAPTLKKYTKGQLVLSGILENQVGEVIQAYSKWISLSVVKEMDGWVLLDGKL